MDADDYIEALDTIRTALPTARTVELTTTDQSNGYGFVLLRIRDESGTELDMPNDAADKVSDLLSDLDWYGVVGEDGHGNATVALTDGESVCRGCGEHVSAPHAPGCPEDGDPVEPFTTWDDLMSTITDATDDGADGPEGVSLPASTNDGRPTVTNAPEGYAGPVEDISTKDTAKKVRKALAAWFPGVKFSVRCASGSMYACIDASWTGGPADSVVDLVMRQYAGAGYDGMSEVKTYRGTVVHDDGAGTVAAYRFAGHYVGTHHTVDDANRDAVRVVAESMVGGPLVADQYYPEGPRDPFGREWRGGTGSDLVEHLARMGVDAWTRLDQGETRPECPMERCALAAGHPYAPIHRDDYGRTFIADTPAAEPERDASAGSETARTLTVTNNARGRLAVHKQGCRDITRDASGGGTSWDVQAADVRAVVLDMYPDATADDWVDYADLQVMPCAGDLPDTADAPALAATVADAPALDDDANGDSAGLVERAERAGADAFATGGQVAPMSSAAFCGVASEVSEDDRTDIRRRIGDAYERGFLAASDRATGVAGPAFEPAPAAAESAVLVEGPEDAGLTVEHTHGGGTMVHGSSKGDGVWDALKGYGRPRSWDGSLYLRGTRDKFGNLGRLRALAEDLRGSGHTVRLVVDNRPRTAAERDADRADRVNGRAAKLVERAGKAYAVAADKRDRAERLTDGIPTGQRILRGHHSQRRHENTLAKSDAARRAGWAAGDKAARLESRAAGAVANEEAKQNPRAMIRRRERLAADLRSLERRHQSNGMDPHPDTLSGQRLAVLREEIEHITAQLDALAAAGTFVGWTRDDFQPGDLVNVGGTWHRVIRANAKSVTVPWWGSHTPETDTKGDMAPYDKVHGRRRDGWQVDSPSGEPWPVSDAVKVDRWHVLTQRANRPYGETAAIIERAHVREALRLVHGLPKDASDKQVEAFTSKPGSRVLTLAYVDAFDRLTAGETFGQVAADVQAADVTPAWTMPEGQPVDIRADQLKPGDILAGAWDTGGFGRRGLSRYVSGPVAWVSKVDNRRERGDWVTFRLADGEEREVKTHQWFAGYPGGRATVRVADLVAGQRADIRGVCQYGRATRLAGYVSTPSQWRKGPRNADGELTGPPALAVYVTETVDGANGWRGQVFTDLDGWCTLLTDEEPASIDPMTAARQAGAGAYAAGRPRAAGADATVRELIASEPVGGLGAGLFSAFNAGYDAAADEAAALVLAEDKAEPAPLAAAADAVPADNEPGPDSGMFVDGVCVAVNRHVDLTAPVPALADTTPANDEADSFGSWGELGAWIGSAD